MASQVAGADKGNRSQVSDTSIYQQGLGQKEEI